MTETLSYTSLLEFEFIQATRLQVFLHATDRTKGYSQQHSEKIVADWEFDVASGLYRKVEYDADDVNKLAILLATQNTAKAGHRALDILHVATAVHLGAKTFLTFDARQKALAKSAGLKVPFK